MVLTLYGRENIYLYKEIKSGKYQLVIIDRIDIK